MSDRIRSAFVGWRGLAEPYRGAVLPYEMANGICALPVWWETAADENMVSIYMLASKVHGSMLVAHAHAPTIAMRITTSSPPTRHLTGTVWQVPIVCVRFC